MVNKNFLRKIEDDGLVIIPDVLSKVYISQLREELEIAIAEDEKGGKVFDQGMVHNCMVRGKKMATILDNKTMNSYVKEVLGDTFILYAYQSSSLKPGKGNYGSRIHVDSPRYIPNYFTNYGVIFPLDDFTNENGATYYIKGSHKKNNIPDETEFYKKASRGCCKSGDMVIFNARIVHAAGVNHTNNVRHSLTLNFCRSYMRQRFDFPRLVPKYIIDSLGSDGKRLLGMNVRVPISLEEFYLPEDKRLYKPNQG